MKSAIQHRQFELSARAASDSERIPVAISSDTPIPRDGYLEVLQHTIPAVDLSRAPLPLLEGHDQARVNVGLVEDLRVDTRSGKLRGFVRFGQSTRARELLADALSGIVRFLSVGYQINDWLENGQTLTATRWMPYEASIVGCPADATVGFFRSMETIPDSVPDNPPSTVLEFDRGVTAERNRLAELDALLDTPLVTQEPSFAGLRQRAISEGWTPDQTSHYVLKELKARARPVFDHTRLVSDSDMGMAHAQRHRVTGGHDYSRDRDELLDAAVDALITRSGLVVKNPHPQADGMRNMSLLDMVKTLAGRRGQDASRITRATLTSNRSAGPMTHSDFPGILANVANKSVLLCMEESGNDWEQWTRTIQLPDFKTATLAALGAFSDLEQIPAGGGPYLYGALNDVAEPVQLLTFGKSFGLSRVALINDDMGQFATISRTFALSASRKLAQLAYARITANPILTQDGKAVFAAEHSNLVGSGSGAAPSPTTLDAGIQAMKKQKPVHSSLQDMSGHINVPPRFLLVPGALEMAARVVTASANYPLSGGAYTDTAINPLSQSNLTVISDPILDDASATAWYLIANPFLVDTVVMAFLSGAGKYGLSIEDFPPDADSDSYKYKIRIDCAAAAVGYAGAYKNAGV